MKKSIIYLGVALVAFANVTLASGSNYKSFSNDMHISYDVSPLNDAICKGDLETVKKLIENGAKVNKFSGGLTPLMTAARYNKVEIIKFLLSKGANPYTTADNGYNALKFAEVSKAVDAVAILKEY
ncbi:ankyrin repeat domain-containing protein [Flavobacterium sp. F-65]|jgi:ankyrin repeat protein|uniref:Ankyrin repeat domain-containing protein n=1 Tax=Flavobacterium pisciphilum TaxID=2893755 RepID=A0ABS8MNZ2_9FLAO|nr:ankyrin repeat domain-containing protein [Flavobacterium sp. F-65]MCC9070465.1 ankyrin repeat domain-containing protein [Flavobacterium sp. F-65]